MEANYLLQHFSLQTDQQIQFYQETRIEILQWRIDVFLVVFN